MGNSCNSKTNKKINDDGVDPFGSYDLNTKDEANAADVIQLIADHSIFPRAMAYNLVDEDDYTPRAEARG
jgi:hypothetical protein